jgi:hypothetical protein
MISIFNGSIVIPKTANHLAVIEDTPLHFNGVVNEAHVVLSGFRAEYTENDHHVKMVKVLTKVKIVQDSPISAIGAKVIVTGELQLRDKNADDPYNGSIYYTLFVKHSGPIVVKS